MLTLVVVCVHLRVLCVDLGVKSSDFGSRVSRSLVVAMCVGMCIDLSGCVLLSLGVLTFVVRYACSAHVLLVVVLAPQMF